MADLPDRPNFFSALNTALSRERVAGLYAALGWQTRKCTWTDYEILGPWCELIVEAEAPILMHGSVADVLGRVEELLSPLRAAGVSVTAECYGPDGEPLLEILG
jgi:hypothetical protein